MVPHFRVRACRRSLRQAVVAAWCAHNPGMHMEFDIVIIGAGMAGASLAWQLTAASDARAAAVPRVLLLEREAQPGYHTTGRSAALFMESYGPPGVQALTRASRAFYADPPAGFAPVPLVAPRGALYIAAEGEQADLWAMQARLEAQGAHFERLDGAAARRLVPLLKPEACAVALYEADAMDLDVNAILQGFLRGFKAAGGELRGDAQPVAVQRMPGPGADWELALATGNGAQTLRTPVIVNAAGAWADELGQLLGAPPIGLVPKRRSAFTFEPPPGADVSHWPMLLDWREHFYVKPDAGLLMGSPANADPMPPHDVQPEALDIAIAIDRIQAVLDVSIRRPRATWAGLRCFVADGEPVIGWDEACAGLFWLTAQGGYGIQSAAGASWLAATLLRHAPLPAALGQALAAQGLGAQRFAPARLRG